MAGTVLRGKNDDTGHMSEAAGRAAPLRVVITACDGVQPLPARNEVKRMFVPYLITYDNRSPRDYAPIYRLMQSWRAVRLAESVWLVDLDTDAIAILRAVLHTMQLDDTAAVLPLQRNGSWAANRISGAATGWLSANISQAMAA
jgi:hypothetical protein